MQPAAIFLAGTVSEFVISLNLWSFATWKARGIWVVHEKYFGQCREKGFGWYIQGMVLAEHTNQYCHMDKPGVSGR